MAADYIDQVGIFSSDQTPPMIATITAQTNTSITFTLPNSVASYQDVWYIRVHSIAGTTSANTDKVVGAGRGAAPAGG